MNFDLEKVTRSLSLKTLKAKENSPHIFFALGVAGVIGSALLACRATLKLDKELDNMKSDLDSVKQTKELVEISDGAYSDTDYAKDLSKVYLKSSVTVIRLYAPAIILGGASVAALTGSHVQLTRRNSALSASMALVSQAYDEYRERVRQVVGEEKELDIYRGLETQELEIDGKKKLVKVKTSPTGHSPYARLFDQSSDYWQNSVEFNRIFITLQQNQANHRLRADGYIFLNDVYQMLGLEKTTPGQIVGWVWQGDGDNYIDFCLYEAIDSGAPYDTNFWLDFNVDGEIFHHLGG